MVTCGAVGCGNSSSTKLTATVKGWHPVPTNDLTLRKNWLAKMKREPPYPKDENFVLCGLHFEEKCFERDLKVYVDFFLLF